MMSKNFDLQLDTLAEAYRSGATTPRKLILELRERALKLNDEFRTFIHLLSEAELAPYLDALEAADPASKPLYGVPFAFKDNIDLAGIATTAGSVEFAYVPEKSATFVARLIELGAVPMGKTNLDQFATGLNGQRSPFGGCRNSVLKDYPSGGSSSGSALAVALGLASFSLGTDTAGSGRVPASLNQLVGTKTTRGLVSTLGLVPACRTLDCITLMSANAADASRILGLAAEFDPGDDYSRRNPLWNAATAFGQVRPFRFGVPRAEDLEWLGNEDGPVLFAEAVRQLEAIGGTAVELDFQPFLQAAQLLYEGPWIAERHAAIGRFMRQHPEGVLPVIKGIVGKAEGYSATQTFEAQYRLQGLKRICDALIEPLDLVLCPTYPRAPTLAELQAEPVAANSQLGLYTNFMNLLDYAAVTVPVGFEANGLPWGATIFSRAFTDQYLLSVAHALQMASGDALVGNAALKAATPPRPAGNDRARVVVCGAHLDGLPLNWQLRQRGGRLLKATRSAPNYRLYALAGGPPLRPGMVIASDGAAIDVEVWELPSAELGSFLTGIPAPLGLGKVQLEDGSWETGFICEGAGLAGAQDITHFGGWRAWLASRKA